MRKHEQNNQPDPILRLQRGISIVNCVRRALEHDYGTGTLPAHLWDYVMSLEEAEEIFSENIEAVEEIKEKGGVA